MKISQLLGWLAGRRLSRAQRFAARWEKEALRCLANLVKAERMLESIRRDFDSAFASHVGDLRRASETIAAYDRAEEALSSEIEVLKEVVLPDLTLAREKVRGELTADIAMSARRAASYAPDNKE